MSEVARPDAERQKLVLGADLSLLKRNVDLGATYSANGRQVEPVTFFRKCGFEWTRLRLFHTPTGHGAQCTDLPYTLALAAQLKRAGFELLLDIHYSDTWADPGKQITPRAWVGMDFDALERAVYRYTCETISAFKNAGAEPDMVQIGHEITPGMLWDHGRVAQAHDTNTAHWQADSESNHNDSWQRFSLLLKAGIQGVHDTAGTPIEIMIHIDRGADIPTNRWFFDNLFERGVPVDAIGQSYYPFWHGMPEEMAETIAFLGTEYDRDVYLAEVAYPHKHHPMYEHALSGDQESWTRLTGTYPLSPDGQKRFMEDIIAIMEASSHGKGLFYWAPEWIPVADFEDEGDATSCWVRALFDEQGNALPALDIFSMADTPGESGPAIQTQSYEMSIDGSSAEYAGR